MDRPASLFVLGSLVVACSAKVSRLPQPGESLCADAFTIEIGGKGFNLALGAHRLGARTEGIFAIGNDHFSQLAHKVFSQTGLSPTMLHPVDGPTGSGIGFTGERGENCLAVYPGANRLLSAHHIRAVEQAVRGAGLVVAQFEIGDEPILEAFSLARAAGARTVLNPSPYRPVDPRILERTSILVLNRVEADCIADSLGLGDAEPGLSRPFGRLADALLGRGLEMVVVTLGREGAVAYKQNAIPLRQPAFPVDAVDTLGAGDAFTAGLVTGLMEGLSLSDSLERAAACGAILCERIGVFDALPTVTELGLFIRTWGTRIPA
ncbi:ribokinase [Microvirga aerophila]|nr:ribokinase [Microvirga aerophila]